MKFGKVDKYMLFGGGDLLIEVALYLKKKNYEIVIITSQRHFDEKLFFNQGKTLRSLLKSNSIRYIISKNVSTDTLVIDEITKNSLGLSFGAAWIFKKNFINSFNGKLLNIHGSRLPIDRGGGGFSWRIMRGDKIGVSLIHQIETGIDTGDIICDKKFIFSDDCRIPIDFYKVNIKKYFLFIKKFLNKINNNEKFSPKKQDETLSTYWPRLYTEKQSYINWFNKPEDIERFICAFDDPYSGAITYLNNEKVKIKNVSSIKTEEIFHPFQTGLVFRIINEAVLVAIKSRILIVKTIINENEENILSKVKLGDRLNTPQGKIDQAFQYRAIYGPDGLVK